MQSSGGRRVGRPRANSAAPRGDPRAVILQVASRLFSTRGISGTSMTDIAIDAGLRPPSLYHYFDSKEAIVAALADYAMSESLAYLAMIETQEGPAANRLYRLLRNHADRLASSPYDLSFLLEPPELRSDRAAARSYLAWSKGVEKLLILGIEEGDLAPTDVDLAIRAVTGLMEAVLNRVHGRTPQRTPTVGQYVARFALRALVRPEQAGVIAESDFSYWSSEA